MRVIKVWIQFEDAPESFDRFVVTPRQNKGSAEIGAVDERERVELHRSLSLRNCLVESPERGEWAVAIPVMSGRVIRVQFYRAFEFRERLGKIQIVIPEHLAIGSVGFGEVIIQVDRPARGGLCLRITFL